MRHLAPALLLAGLFVAACTSSKETDGGTPDASTGACTSARDCAASDPAQCASPKVCVCSSQMCVPVCQANSDCSGNQICVEGSCSAPGCGGNADCSGGQVCIGGACSAATTASQIHTCVISPDAVDVHQGATVQLSAVAQDSSGNALPFTGTAWSITSGGTVASIDAASGLVTGGSATAGSSQVAVATATMGTVTCTANINVYGNVTAANSLRVVVIDEDTKAPVVGAHVVLDQNTSGAQVTAADGSVIFTTSGSSGTHDVHAFAANHDYASYIGISASATDLMIPLRQFYPIANRSPFDGSISVADFSQLTELNQIAHVAFFGSSVAGSLLDFTLDNFMGQTRDVTITISGTQTLPGAPGGFILGLGSDLYSTGSYSMYADPGRRVLWGIGGNLDINTILTIATPIINGGSVNIGQLLPQVLPLLGNLEVGDVVGVEPGASGNPPAAAQNQSVTLDTPMHMKVAIKAPNLPQFNGQYVDGVIALTGASAFPLGFTPLGVTAGLAATDANGTKTGAVLDPTCASADGGTDGCATNNLPLSMAARNHGLESYPYGVVLVALNFGALTGGGDGTIAVSGKLQTQNDIAFAGGTSAPTSIDMSTTPFMTLPGSTNSVSYAKTGRTLAITSDADAATQIYKFTIQSTSHQTWSVYLPPAGANGSTATLIDPTAIAGASLVDLQADTAGTGWISAISTTSTSNNYASLTGFGNVTVDALGNNLKTFAVQTVTLGQ